MKIAVAVVGSQANKEKTMWNAENLEAAPLPVSLSTSVNTPPPTYTLALALIQMQIRKQILK